MENPTLQENRVLDSEQEARRCRELGISLWFPGMPGYHSLLASVQDAPKVLYVRGNLNSMRTLAIVGSRRPTPYGLRMARRLAAEAAQAGIVTVSGLARGIDTAVHRATLDAGGVTWAVLGSGLEHPYPSENAGLMKEIVDRGGVVLSELPLSARPSPENFPRRNRIISGLSWGSVVVEGDAKSGALITAKCALEQGREVFAVPGSVDSEMSEGPNRLIGQGARLARSLEDVLEELPMLAGRRSHAGAVVSENPATPPVSVEEQKILELIGSETIALESMVQETGWNVEHLTGLLVEMEMKGLVSVCSGQRYARS